MRSYVARKSLWDSIMCNKSKNSERKIEGVQNLWVKDRSKSFALVYAEYSSWDLLVGSSVHLASAFHLIYVKCDVKIFSFYDNKAKKKEFERKT